MSTITSTGKRDSRGIEINVGDTVIVTAWGAPVRRYDCRERFVVTGVTRSGNLTHDTDVANGAAVGPGYVTVARRDGQPGFEANL